MDHLYGLFVYLPSPKGNHLKYVICLQFQTTNNEVENESHIQGLELAKVTMSKGNCHPGRLIADYRPGEWNM